MNHFWTFEEVEDRLVEAALLWRRSPGGGGWPFATDGPWHLMTRAARASSADEALRIEHEAEPRSEGSRLPLSRAEVARRDEASEWLALVPVRDRKLVVLAAGDLARGRSRVDWMAMRRKVGVELGANGLRMRYERAIGGIARALTKRGVVLAA